MPEEEKQSIGVENSEAQESQTTESKQQETPDEKTEREFRENEERVLLRLEDHLAFAAIQEQLGMDLEKILEQDIPIEIPPARTLPEIREEMASERRGIASIHDTIRKAALRMRGVKNSSDLEPLVYYAEHYLQKISDEHVVVENTDIEEKIKGYEAQGYKVDNSYTYQKGDEKAHLRLRKRVPHKVSIREAKRFSEWLGRENDPIEFLERLQHIGFEIDTSQISWQFKHIKQFIATPSAVQALRNIDEAGIKSASEYFGPALKEEKDVFLEFIQDKQAQDLLTPETIKRIKNFEQYSGGQIKVRDRIPLKAVAEIFSHKDSVQLLSFIADQQDPRFARDAESILYRMTMLKKAGVSSELAALARNNRFIARRAYDHALQEIWSEDRVRHNFESVVQSEAVQKLAADEKLSRLLFAFIECAGTKESEIDNASFSQLVEEIEKIKDNPHALALLELAREWGLSLGDKRFDWQSWTPRLGELSYLIGQNDAMEVLVKPEFTEFVKKLRDVFDYELSWSALINIADDIYRAPGGYSPRWLLSAFQDGDFRKRLDDEDFKEAAKYFDKLVTFSEDQHFYQSLAHVPHAVQMAEALEEKFGYALKKEDRFMFVQEFASYNGRREELFTDETVNLYKQLHDAGGYVFALGDAESLCSLAKHKGVKRLVSHPEARPALEAVIPFGIGNLWHLRELDSQSYSLVPTMVQELSLTPSHDLFTVTIPYIAEHQEVALPALRELKQRGFDIAMHMRDELEKLPFFHEHKDLIIPAAEELKRYGLPVEAKAMSMLPVLKRLGETRLAPAIEKKAPLLLRDDYRAILDYALLPENFDLLIQDENDLIFINSLIGRYSKTAFGLLKDYRECIAKGALSRDEKHVALEFLEHMRVLSPTLINGYKEAKASGTREMYVVSLKATAEKLTGSSPVSQEERAKPYYQDLLRGIYPNNAGNWTNYENNASCEDRRQDLEKFSIKPRYEIDLLSAAEIKLKEGQELDAEAIKNLKKEILAVAKKAENQDYDAAKMKETSREAIDNTLKEQQEKGWLKDMPAEQLIKSEEKLFLLMAEALYEDSPLRLEEMKQSLIEYEFSEFENIRDYMQGTSDRVSQANNQDYALLCELNTFYADRMKEAVRRCAEAALLNPLMKEKMVTYFKQQQERMKFQEIESNLNKLQADKLGFTEGFIKQIRRTLEQGGKKYSDDQIKRLVHLYEVMAVSLDDELKPSEKKRTKAFAGQLRAQRAKTLQAIGAITGGVVHPDKIHLGEMNLEEFLRFNRAMKEGAYDEEQFAQYTLQKCLDIFEEEKETISRELEKFTSTSGSKREVMNAYIAKSKETANARMVGGVCVSGDNPKKVGEKCMWNMPHYFELVLQDPESYRCLGLALLHYFEEEGEKVLSASFNPSSTYLYSVDEKALFKGIIGALETFTKENGFARIVVSKNPQIRTNRTGGAFEEAMKDRIAAVKKEYSFSGPRQFSCSPVYFTQDSQKYTATDVLWEKENTA